MKQKPPPFDRKIKIIIGVQAYDKQNRPHLLGHMDVTMHPDMDMSNAQDFAVDVFKAISEFLNLHDFQEQPPDTNRSNSPWLKQ